jgi:kynurenine 3-monooxygenase
VQAFFAREFPQALALIPELLAQFAAHRQGFLGTVHCPHWHDDERLVLIGDAAHAIVPFHGQGMNCAFEDCVALAQALDAETDLAAAYAAFEAERKPDATAIQRMALDNYIEMRDLVDDPAFLLQRQLELALQQRHPGRFIPHYAMVTFMRIRYSLALARSEIQRGILEAATRGHASLDGIDWAAADAAVLDQLEPLEDAA